MVPSGSSTSAGSVSSASRPSSIRSLGDDVQAGMSADDSRDLVLMTCSSFRDCRRRSGRRCRDGGSIAIHAKKGIPNVQHSSTSHLKQHQQFVA